MSNPKVAYTSSMSLRTSNTFSTISMGTSFGVGGGSSSPMAILSLVLNGNCGPFGSRSVNLQLVKRRGARTSSKKSRVRVFTVGNVKEGYLFGKINACFLSK